MIRRHLIAWTVSGTAVIGTAGLTVVTVTAPPPHEAADAAASPPVTVYDDRYIDDYVVATTTGLATTVPGADERAPAEAVGMAVAAGAPSAPSGAMVANVRATTAGAVPPPTAPQSERTTDTPLTTNAPSTAAPSNTPPVSSPRTTTTARPTTTTAPTTTVTTIPGAATTLPPGAEVPRDWPVGVPYPPIPSGCRQPHLEDNGMWNCEH